MALTDRLKERGAAPRRPTLKEWLAQHPGLEADIQDAFAQGYSVGAVYEQLVADYGYPLGDGPLYAIAKTRSAAR